ncbi:energy transducer TonB [Teredinibacter turnerae]|uniref:Protein TonB n=1 Tax=Teredinibacter turnerae (strain ATCC 39867 / T7901) TaxID=377629 RepID=C5BIP8_TERTT|nr:energy transducer TonB [Teredinibacter turnerae]ACR11587.1 TonB family protein [Teredinibacter turnerae T7901]
MATTAANPALKGLSISVLAVAIGLLIFLLMHVLIRPGSELEKLDGQQTYLNFVRVDNSDDDLQTKKRKPPKEPPPPETPPETPEMNQQMTDINPNLNMNMPSIGVPINSGDGPFLGALSQGDGLAGFDTDVIPVVRVPPTYPRAAKQAKIQGYVTMAVTINPDGTVSDAEVLEAEPPRLFDQAAIAAIKRWKFRPKIVDGMPKAQRAKQTIEFKLSR